jgi:hypothetical protein
MRRGGREARADAPGQLAPNQDRISGLCDPAGGGEHGRRHRARLEQGGHQLVPHDRRVRAGIDDRRGAFEGDRRGVVGGRQQRRAGVEAVDDTPRRRRQEVNRLRVRGCHRDDAALTRDRGGVGIHEVGERRPVPDAGQRPAAPLEPPAPGARRAVRGQGAPDHAPELRQQFEVGGPLGGEGVREDGGSGGGPPVAGVRFDQEQPEDGGEQGVRQLAGAADGRRQHGRRVVAATLPEEQLRTRDRRPETVVPGALWGLGGPDTRRRQDALRLRKVPACEAQLGKTVGDAGLRHASGRRQPSRPVKEALSI